MPFENPFKDFFSDFLGDITGNPKAVVKSVVDLNAQLQGYKVTAVGGGRVNVNLVSRAASKMVEELASIFQQVDSWNTNPTLSPHMAPIKTKHNELLPLIGQLRVAIDKKYGLLKQGGELAQGDVDVNTVTAFFEGIDTKVAELQTLINAVPV